MIVAGFGFRSNAQTEDLAAALAMTGQHPDVLATLTRKATEPAILGLGERLGVPVIGVEVEGTSTPTHSSRIEDVFKTGSVAEAAALGAAGSGARILLPRIATENGMATVAIAEGQGL